MSPVNAFHVYFTSGDLSREREKKKRKRKRFIDPNPKRFERARAYFTSRNESRSANFPSDADPDSRYFFDSRPPRMFKHIFLEEVIIRGYVQHELLLDFLLNFFFCYSTVYIHVNVR